MKVGQNSLRKLEDDYIETIWRGLKSLIISEKIEDEGLEFDDSGHTYIGQLGYTVHDLYGYNVYEDDLERFVDQFENMNIDEDTFDKLVIDEVLRRNVDTKEEVRIFMDKLGYKIEDTSDPHKYLQYNFYCVNELIN